MKELVVAIEENVAPSHEKVQSLMRQHYECLKRTWIPTKESYIGLAEIYQQHEFRIFYDSRHPKLLDYMIEAMKLFAEKELS